MQKEEEEEEEEERRRKAPEWDRLQKIQSPGPSPLSTPLDARAHLPLFASSFGFPNCAEQGNLMIFLPIFDYFRRVLYPDIDCGCSEQNNDGPASTLARPLSPLEAPGTATDFIFIHHCLTICILLLARICGYFSDTRDSKVGARKPGLEVGSVVGLPRCETLRFTLRRIRFLLELEKLLLLSGELVRRGNRAGCEARWHWPCAVSSSSQGGSASSIHDTRFCLNVETELVAWQHGIARFVSSC